MTTPRRPPTDYRGFRDYLRSVGAYPERQTGDHEQWRLPNRRLFTLPIGRSSYATSRHRFNRWRDLQRVLRLA